MFSLNYNKRERQSERKRDKRGWKWSSIHLNQDHNDLRVKIFYFISLSHHLVNSLTIFPTFNGNGNDSNSYKNSNKLQLFIDYISMVLRPAVTQGLWIFFAFLKEYLSITFCLLFTCNRDSGFHFNFFVLNCCCFHYCCPAVYNW